MPVWLELSKGMENGAEDEVSEVSWPNRESLEGEGRTLAFALNLMRSHRRAEQRRDRI